jgi:DNA-binding beta-propeller fold protein YncE
MNLSATAIALFLLSPVAIEGAAQTRERPGLTEGNTQVLLPSGWSIAPVGKHLPVGDLPMDMAESPDGRFLVVTNGGYTKPWLDVIDLERWHALDRQPLENAWLGLAFHPDGGRVFSSAGGAQAVDELRFEQGALKPHGAIALPSAVKDSFVGGLAVSKDGTRLFALNVLGDTLTSVDLATRAVVKAVPLPAEPYAVVASADGQTLFVSLWGGSKVLFVDAQTLAIRADVLVGEHPSALALTPDGRRLFVACASTNAVWALDVAERRADEQIKVALYPEAPHGSTPNGLGLSPDGKTLLVASADNNTVAVVDVEKAGHSVVSGFIPTGWYPTAARFTRDGKRILVLSGKGLRSEANPRGPDEPFYIGQLLHGTLTVLAVPDAPTLAGYTKTVYRLTPYTDATRLAPAGAPEHSPIPRKVGEPSKVKHLFYVIRENRTYDQILGDVAAGNGDRNLCLFGEEVTPNAHSIAAEFALFDNFYVNAEVSADGHAFSTGAYATDFVEKTWPMNYAQRGGRYMTDSGTPERNPYGSIAAPPTGYLWDAARRKGLSVRSYGEFASRAKDEAGKETGPAVANVPGLVGQVAPDYPPWDLAVPDARRIDAWLAEFRRFEQDGNLPALSILHLPNDHTSGTHSGTPTPRAMVGENDQALGRFVEAISKSRFWPESAIFVVEDDAQDGPDHVDAHRSVLLVASPFVRKGAVDSTLYTTCGVLRTMELILGLPPLSQCDAAATPLYAAFQPTALPRPFAALAPRIPLDEKNLEGAPGAAASATLDFSGEDRIPMRLMNEILWASVRGPNVAMPPPVRAAFIRPLAESDEDEEEEK